MIIVTPSSFQDDITKIKQAGTFAADTETTGLNPFQNARMFSLAISTAQEDYYFNFNYYEDMDLNHLLDRRHLEGLKGLFGLEETKVYMHNAKFDMHIMAREGIRCAGTVHCTEAIARLMHNDLLSYKLDALAKLDLNTSKDDTVKEYILENKLYNIRDNGKKKVKDLQFFHVPFKLISRYACKDTQITFQIGELQTKHIEKYSQDPKRPPLSAVYENELELTKTLFEMEETGIRIDQEYTRKAYGSEVDKYKQVMQQYKKLTGLDFVDSAKGLAPAFDNLGLKYGKTEKGSASFTDKILEGIDNPLAQLVKNYRKSYKMANSYYKNFMHFQDANGFIHTNFKQSGAKTGRMSATDPALQTLPKPSDDLTGNINAVRRCFIPRDQDYVFFMPDYDQMEYRFMLEYAEEMDVIAEVLAGTDVHQATANMLGVSRKEAKTINFMLLYGGGPSKLAADLGCRVWDAKQKRDNYFRKLPNVKKFIAELQAVTKSRGFFRNWMGRVTFIEPDFVYRAPNSLIQGGTADVVKLALNKCKRLLSGTKSKVVLQVHDELIFELHRSELELAIEIKRVMETAYKHRLIPLTCSSEYSWKSLADKVDGLPKIA